MASCALGNFLSAVKLAGDVGIANFECAFRFGQSQCHTTIEVCRMCGHKSMALAAMAAAPSNFLSMYSLSLCCSYPASLPDANKRCVGSAAGFGIKLRAVQR